MTPFYFGPDDRLFGLYERPPGRNARADGIVVSYPIGHEYGRSHRGFRHLARLLTLAGFPVLRFDYFGSGDSRGEEGDGDLDRWFEDTVAAIEYMKSRCRRVGLVGSRLSGALAMKVGAELGPLDSLALWHPVVDGRRFLREINAGHELHERKHGWQEQESRRLAGLESGLEVLGFHLSDRAVRQLEQLDLEAIRRPPAKRILLVDNGDSGEFQQLRSHLERLGAQVDEAPIRESMMWFAEPYEMVFPTQSIQRIVQWLSEVYRA
jgi:pimeloyl-ACP methyl ester carboxylesterase